MTFDGLISVTSDSEFGKQLNTECLLHRPYMADREIVPNLEYLTQARSDHPLHGLCVM